MSGNKLLLVHDYVNNAFRQKHMETLGRVSKQTKTESKMLAEMQEVAGDY